MFDAIVCLVIPVQLVTRGGSTGKFELSSPCPYCNDGKDRFRIWPFQSSFGRFWCRKCKISGDGLKFVKDFLADNQNPLVTEFLNSVNYDGRSYQKHTKQLSGKINNDWSQRAAYVSNFYKQQLRNKYYKVTELHERRISQATSTQFRLGYVLNSVYEDISSWGYTVHDDTSPKLLIPSGILIPRHVGDNIIGINVRMDTPIDGRRYHLVRGSYSGPIMLSQQNKKFLCVVESDLDEILLSQECSDITDVCSLGSITNQVSRNTGIDLKAYDNVAIAFAPQFP